MKYSPAFANVRRKVTGATTEQQRNVAKNVGYDILGDILTTPANMNEEEYKFSSFGQKVKNKLDEWSK